MIRAQQGTSLLAGNRDKLRLLLDEAQALEAAYPGHYSVKGLTPEQAESLAAERLLARGFSEASDKQWVRNNLNDVAVRVLAKECLLYRLTDTLNRRNDVTKAIEFAKKRGCDETEAFDAVEDAILAIIRRGHGMQAEDTLLRYFRTILWEKISALHDAKAKEKKRIAAAATSGMQSGISAELSPLDVLTATEARDLLIVTLKTVDLPFERKAALMLKYGADWGSEAIAALLNVSAAQVDVMNHRSKGTLKIELERRHPEGLAHPQTRSGRAVSVEAAASALPSAAERAALLLHGLFEMPLSDVARFCKVPESRILELAAMPEKP